MGRTFRLRKRKSRKNVVLSSDPSFVNLTQWMSKRGWKQTTSLCLAKFKDTGRGLMARCNIEQGDALVSIPRSLLITTATVVESPVGCAFSRVTLTPNNFLCQEILACFLLWEKHLGNTSIWANYLETLPKSFSIPHCLDKSHINSFPWFLQEQALNSIELVQSCFMHLIPSFKDYVCNHCQLSALDIFVWDDFLWAWCCVNTRAVFIDPENVPSHPIPLRDRNCLALAPYLDMFNHSDAVEVKVGLNKNNNCYEIVTLQPVKKFNEVFINYGPHSNTKLFLEYGFVLPRNVHDTIPIDFNQLKEVFSETGITIPNEYDKRKFCERHGLITQLYLSKGGLSWNCLTVLKILLCCSNNHKYWQEISFKGESSQKICDNSFKIVKEGIFRKISKDLLKSHNLIFGECSHSCCTFWQEGKRHPTVEMCRVLIHRLKSILTSASLVDDCGQT